MKESLCYLFIKKQNKRTEAKIGLAKPRRKTHIINQKGGKVEVSPRTDTDDTRK